MNKLLDSPHESAGRLTPMTYDGRWVGWAHGGNNALRSRDFLKSDTEPRTLWPEWDEVRGIQSCRCARPFLVEVTIFGGPRKFICANCCVVTQPRAGWPVQGIWGPIKEFEIEVPLRDIAKGSTGDGCDALD